MFRLIDRDFLIDEFKSIDARLEEEHEKCKDPSFCTADEYDGMNTLEMNVQLQINKCDIFHPELEPNALRTSTALIYDGIMILAQALKQIGAMHLELEFDQRIYCSDANSRWDKGLTITNYMKWVS